MKHVFEKRKHLVFYTFIMLLLSFPMKTSAQSNSGKNGTVNIAKVEKMAKEGDRDAEFLIGYYYYEGQHFKKDLNMSCIYFAKAASHGHKYAKAWLAHVCDEEKDYKEAYNWALDYIDNYVNDGTDTAHGWFNRCTYLIGWYKFNGMGTSHDVNGAIKYYEMARNNGMSSASTQLYRCYYQIGDMEKCFYYANDEYKLEGFPLDIAKHYLYGWGCKQDLEKVRTLLQEMANGKLIYNSPDGSVRTMGRSAMYAAMCYIGIADYFDKNKKNHYEEAVRWLTMVVESEEALNKAKGEAMCVLQRCYRFGRGVPRNIDKANELEHEAKKLITKEEYDKVTKCFDSSY